MSEHAPLAPSAAHRWMLCPGAPAAESVAEDVSSAYADEGTLAHDVAETMLTGGNVPSEIEPDMVLEVTKYTRYVESLGGDQFYEQKVVYHADLLWGTADAIVIVDDTMHVVDLKYGKGVKVYAHENFQMLCYAVGAIRDFGIIYDINHVEMHIVQPRLDHFDSWPVTMEELAGYITDIDAGIERCKQEDAPRVAGETQCRFCKVKATCPAFARHVQEIAQIEFQVPEQSLLPDLATLSVEDQARIYGTRELVSSFYRSIEQNLTNELRRAREVPGYKLVAGRKNRAWGNEEEALAALRKKLKKKECVVEKMISPAQAEKLLGKDHPILEAHVVKPPGDPTIVPSTDKRPALTSDALLEFEPVTEEA